MATSPSTMRNVSSNRSMPWLLTTTSPYPMVSKEVVCVVAWEETQESEDIKDIGKGIVPCANGLRPRRRRRRCWLPRHARRSIGFPGYGTVRELRARRRLMSFVLFLPLFPAGEIKKWEGGGCLKYFAKARNTRYPFGRPNQEGVRAKPARSSQAAARDEEEDDSTSPRRTIPRPLVPEEAPPCYVYRARVSDLYCFANDFPLPSHGTSKSCTQHGQAGLLHGRHPKIKTCEFCASRPLLPRQLPIPSLTMKYTVSVKVHLSETMSHRPPTSKYARVSPTPCHNTVRRSCVSKPNEDNEAVGVTTQKVSDKRRSRAAGMGGAPWSARVPERLLIPATQYHTFGLVKVRFQVRMPTSSLSF